MSRFKSTAAAGAMLMLSAQPCLAADDFRSIGAVERRSGAFAGMTLRVPMGRQDVGATARLQLATVHQAYNPESRLSGRSWRASGLELGLSGSAKPTFYIGGRNASEVQKRLKMDGSGTTVLLVGGVVLLAVILLAAIASAAPTPGPREGAFD